MNTFLKINLNEGRILLLVVVTILNLTSYSQTPVKYSENIPSSPEVINYTKYGIVPVNLYSGMANTSISLFDLTEGDIHIPITLSYYNRGLKPAEIASNTGLGWSLQVGGMITRIVRGQVDENPQLANINNYTGIADLSMKFEDFAEVSQMQYSQKILCEITKGITDGEPDIYTFNFNGYSGNFIIRNSMAILTPKQNINIKILPEITGNTFVITTENGTQYTFGMGGCEVTEPHVWNQVKLVVVKPYISAWHLTQVKSSDKNHYANFTYSTSNLKREDNIGGSYDLAYSAGGYPSGSYTTYFNYGAFITTKSVATISTLPSHQTINFDVGTLRTDIKDFQNNYTLWSLGSLSVTNMNNTLIKKWIFNYDYFGSNSYKKLKLKSLNQIDPNNIPYNKHSFSYVNENVDLPDNKTNGIDHWGYYNGVTSNNCLIPSEILPNRTMVGAIPANRTPNQISALNTVLSKIVYPTGGYTLYDYEQNIYYKSDINQEGLKIPLDMAVEYNSNNAVWDVDNYYVKSEFQMPICVQQDVKFTYRLKMPNFTSSSTGVKFFYPTFTIRKIWNNCDDVPSNNPNNVIWTRTGQFYPIDANGTYEVSDVINLTTGKYSIEVKIDSRISSFYGSLTYSQESNTSNNLFESGPGLRIATISNYNSENVLLTQKEYKYIKDDGTSSGEMIGSNVYKTSNYTSIYFLQNSASTTTHTTYSDNLESNVASLMNEKMYYSKVTENTSGNVDKLRTDYFFTSFDLINAGVELTKQIEYKYDLTTGTYNKIHSKELFYNSLNEDHNIMCLESNLSIQQDGVLYIYIPSIQNGDDPDDPQKYYFDFYAGNSYIIPVANKKLIAETEKYFYSINRFIQDSIITETNYKYHSDTPQYPYETEQNTSSNKIIYMNPMYCYDYNLLGSNIKSLKQIETEYNQSLTNIIDTYSLARGTNYDSFTSYYNSYNTLRNSKKTELNLFDASLNNQLSVETDVNKKAILLMQKNNMISIPIEQKHYVKDITKKLSAAKKYCFTVLGDYVVQFNELWNCELLNPIAEAEINNNLYKKKVTNLQDSYSNLLCQNLNNAFNNTYIWGYHHTYIVAKIANATFSDVIDVLDGSQVGLNLEANSNPTKDEIQAYLAPLATNNITKNAQITIYTYEPLVGMKTLTDPRGVTTYYEYDSFNRLKQTYIIENGEKKILQMNDYHYSNQ